MQAEYTVGLYELTPLVRGLTFIDPLCAKIFNLVVGRIKIDQK